MQRSFATAKPDETLDQAMSRLQASRSGIIVVMDHEMPCGMLTAEQVGQMLALDEASRARRKPASASRTLSLHTS
jgi:predicted transcriptional regulator